MAEHIKGDIMSAKRKKQPKGIVKFFKDLLSDVSDEQLKDLEKKLKKQNLEILSLKQTILVYEKAILNEREVATNALNSLAKRNADK
jgi:hypothetical protein